MAEGDNKPHFTATFMEFEGLKETANIGTGAAANALSNIFKRKVNFSLPTIDLASPSEVNEIVSSPKEMFVGVFSSIEEGINGNIVMIMPFGSALQLTREFQDNTKELSDNITDMDKKLLEKIGVAVIASYLSPIAKFFEQKIRFNAPNVISAFGEALFDFILIDLGKVDKVVVIKLGFDIDAIDVKGDLILFLSLDSLNQLLLNIKRKFKRKEEEQLI
ncbi:hypothetical protein GOV08_05210 [Candidatus Woesearchaeota archaeon]|nr:hypothetical protein [Candidatus Woesearchaeota archaeon]